ncbi:MAG: DUF2934 domain-containing protein [Dehalococcoidales bacterium]|nr:DUF2934 domain-containing protein [Dehalococcoidales bacterium]
MVTEKQIKELAYTYWEQEGRPEGKDLEYYFRAKELLEREAASSAANELASPALTLQTPPVPKSVERHPGKRRSKKA